MDVARLEKQNHYEAITEQIRLQITSGKLKVGDKLPSTKEMAERFGVGRSTMREALSALKAVGLIEIRQGGGCRVIRDQPPSDSSAADIIKLNGSTLLELLEARQALEVSNASIASVKRTVHDVESLQAIVAEMAAAEGDDEKGERLDVAFHYALAQAAHNSIMASLFETIMQQTETAIRDVRRAEMYANRAVASRLLDEHTAIAEAIAAGDPERASSAMRSHLLHVERIVTKHTR